MFNLIHVPDKKLRQISKKVEKVDSNTAAFIQNLVQTLVNKTDPPGVGISAIQVGEPLRIFVTYLPQDLSLPASKWSAENLRTVVHLNPEITKTSTQKTLGGSNNRPSLEGCLSIPRIYGPVERHEWVELTYHTLPENGRLESSVDVASLPLITKRYSGFAARVMQHEFDHLEGVLFTDYTLKNGLPLYFEEGEDLVEIKDPSQIIKW